MEPTQTEQTEQRGNSDHEHKHPQHGGSEHEHIHHSEHHHHRHPEHHHHPEVEVKVNRKDVRFKEHRVTGAVIKSTAIAQGVAIQMDFQLFKIIHGEPLKEIGDDEHVNLHECDAFRATAPDDTSSESSDDR